MTHAPHSPLERFLFWEQQIPDEVFLRQPIERNWHSWTWRQAGNECRRIAAGIQALGLQKGDRVAILSKNCAQWILADIAIMMAGCISVPLYPTLTAQSIRNILEHSGARAIFLGKLDDYSQQQPGLPETLLHISVSAYGISTPLNWEGLLRDYPPLSSLHTWDPEEILTIVYTSGTTGAAKGVMHKACTFGIVLEKVMHYIELKKRPSMFSYLPLSHVAERMAVEMNIIFNGGMASFAESLDTFAADLASVQPDAFFAVPRIWAKFREGVLKKVPQQKLNRLLRIPLLNNLVKRKIRKGLGLSKAKVILSAAAPISLEMLLWYEQLGITIYQVYGMTEDSVYAHFNKRGSNRFGSVGKPLPGLQVKFSDEGEILVKSPGNFLGYYKEPALTASAFDPEGYLKTGDKGEYDQDGYLYITGRIKDQFKTDKGKYISPAPIELQLLHNKHIEQACVVGMGIPQPIALVVLAESGKRCSRDQLQAELNSFLDELNPRLENFEQLEKIIVLRNDWTVENGLMTPTLKVKRNEIEKIFLPNYKTWYQMQDRILWE